MLKINENLHIREIKEEDIDILYDFLNDDKVLEYYEGRDRKFSKRYIKENFLKNDDISRNIIIYNDEKVGFIQYYVIDKEEYLLYGYDSSKDLVYGLDLFIGKPNLWNCGIGTIILKNIINFIKNNKKANCLAIDPHVDNERAIHVYEKVGFKKVKVLREHELHEGVLKDCYLMEIKL